jgi:hypothetical protein
MSDSRKRKTSSKLSTLDTGADDSALPFFSMRTVFAIFTMWLFGVVAIYFATTYSSESDGPDENRLLSSDHLPWTEAAARISDSTPHITEMQRNVLSERGYVVLDCFSTASMHLLATLPANERKQMLAKCPEKCADNERVGVLSKYGGGVWGSGEYGVHSFICLALIHDTGHDGGFFLFTPLDTHQKPKWKGSQRHGIKTITASAGVAFRIKNVSFPLQLDMDSDGKVTDEEAALAGAQLLAGVPGLNAATAQMDAATAKAIDADGNFQVAENELMEWLEHRLHDLAHPQTEHQEL